MSLLLVTFLGLALVYILNYFYRHFTYWQRQGVPSHRFMTFGWAKMPIYEFAMLQTQQYGRIHGAYGVTHKLLMINDAKLVRDLSIRELHKFAARNTSLECGTTNIGKSIFFMTANDDWKRIRSILTPAFTSGKLKRMMTPIERITANFIEHLRPMAKSGEEFDLKRHIGGFTMDVIARCGYGIEIDSVTQPNHPVVVNAKRILNVDVTLNQVLCFTFPAIARLFRLDVFNKEAIEYFDDLTFKIIEERMKGAVTKQNPDLIGLMMESSQEMANGTSNDTAKLKGITKDEISGQGILFFIAGFDTTHASFDHVIFNLAKHPEWEEKLFQELNAVRDELDYDKFKTLPILNAIINESLRLNPPLVLIQREAIADCELLDTGIKIEKNTIIQIQPYCIMRDEEYFPEPNAFKPERFLGTSLENHFAFIPFGVGPRLCVGMRFAQNELRIGIANFVLNYRVRIDPNFKLEYFKGSVLMSAKRLLVSISER